MLKGGSGAAGGGHRISAGRDKRLSTKSVAAQAQARARFLRVGAAVGFGAMRRLRIFGQRDKLKADRSKGA
jgi:hypothetical protein